MNKLYRSRDTKVFAGIAGGLAEYFDIDPLIVRAIFVVAAFGWGFSILAYIVLWIVVPLKPYEYLKEQKSNNEAETINSPAVESRHQKGNGKNVFAIILILIGFLGLLHNVFPDLEFQILFPIILIIIGLIILSKAFIFKSNSDSAEIL